ncbi:MAG: S1 RNA-binding domain-containing protein, partial [Pirellula sp.]
MTDPNAPIDPANAAGGPINLEAIRRMREAQQSKPEASPSRERGPKPPKAEKSADSSPATETPPEKIDAEGMPARYKGNKDSAPVTAPKVPVPSTRDRSDDEDALLNDVLADADLDGLMIGDRNLKVGRRLEDGSRYPGKIIKVHNQNVFVSLGGPDEGVVPLLQFDNPPEPGTQVDVLVRAFNAEEGLYDLAIPGETVAVNDWDDLNEGAVVEAKIESANTGGVECKVGNVRGFIPISQLSVFRIESAADY